MEGSGRTRLFREVNEHIDELLERFGGLDEAEFLCECPSAGCSRLLTLARHEFEQIRREGAFIVAPCCLVAALSWGTEVRYVVVPELRAVASTAERSAQLEAAARLGAAARMGAELPAPPVGPGRPGGPAHWAGAATRRRSAPTPGSGWRAPAA
jgi:hypothetical protein